MKQYKQIDMQLWEPIRALYWPQMARKTWGPIYKLSPYAPDAWVLELLRARKVTKHEIS